MTYEPDTADVAEELLHNLRGRLGTDSVDYAEPPERIHGGFDNFIYAFRLSGAPRRFSGRLILRLYRPDTDPRQACFESAIQNVLAGAGYPSPPVLLIGRSGDGLGLPFVVMPMVPGRLMLDTLWGPTAIRMAATLAKTQTDLHAIDPEPVRRALARAGVRRMRWPSSATCGSWNARSSGRSLVGLRPGARWLADNRPPAVEDTVVCHGDFHPLNVLVDQGRVSGVIDWSARRLRLGDPAYDVGATAAILAHGPVNVPDLLAGPINLGRRCFVAAYRRAYVRDRPIDRDRIRYYEALRSLVFLVEAGAARQAEAGVIPPILKRTAFGDERTVRGVVQRFHAITRRDPANSRRRQARHDRARPAPEAQAGARHTGGTRRDRRAGAARPCPRSGRARRHGRRAGRRQGREVVGRPHLAALRALADVEPSSAHAEHRRFVDEFLAPRVEVKKGWSFETRDVPPRS